MKEIYDKKKVLFYSYHLSSMKKKVTKFLVEITMRDKANKSFLDDVLGDTDTMIYKHKILKKEDVNIPWSEDNEW